MDLPPMDGFGSGAPAKPVMGPPPARSFLGVPGKPVAVAPGAARGAAFPMANSPQVAGNNNPKKRNKVQLAPGHSALDWARISNGGDLSGAGGRLRRIPMEEIALHNKEDDAWTAIRGMVYNITPYIDYHPGGRDELLRCAGRDSTDLFMEIHAWVNIDMLFKSCILGVVGPSEAARAAGGRSSLVVPGAPRATTSATASSAAAPAEPTYAEYTVTSVTPLTADTSVFRLAAPVGHARIAVPVGGHVNVRALVDGRPITRPYTPISVESGQAYVDLLVKRYNDGVISRHVHGLGVGSTLSISTPIPAFALPANTGAVGMVAAGTGITPMLKVLHGILGNDGDPTPVSLLFANRTEADVLMREELRRLANEHEGQFALEHVISAPTKAETRLRGRVTKEMLQRCMPRPKPTTMILVCGPAGFSGTVAAMLLELGHAEAQIHVFKPAATEAPAPAASTTTSTGTTSTATPMDVQSTAGAESASGSGVREIRADELAQHNTQESGWIAIRGKVYDVTSFIADHPGGGIILTALGRDATVDFDRAYHSPAAKRMLDQYFIGNYLS